MFEFNKNILCPWDIRPDFFEHYPDYYAVKYAIAKAVAPSKIIEIGVRAGYSAWTFLKACPDATYNGFDANNQTHGGEGPKNYMEWADIILKPFKYKLWDNFDTQKVDKLPVSGDFYHIDGDHSLKGTYHDIYICFQDLCCSGIILVDDYDFLQPKNGYK